MTIQAPSGRPIGIDKKVFKPTHVVGVVTNSTRDAIEDACGEMGIISDNIYIVTRAHAVLREMAAEVRRSIDAVPRGDLHEGNAVSVIVEVPPITNLAMGWSEVMREIRHNFHGRMARNLIHGPNYYSVTLDPKHNGMIPRDFTFQTSPENPEALREQLLRDEVGTYNFHHYDPKIHGDNPLLRAYSFEHGKVKNTIKEVLSRPASEYHRATMRDLVTSNAG